MSKEGSTYPGPPPSSLIEIQLPSTDTSKRMKLTAACVRLLDFIFGVVPLSYNRFSYTNALHIDYQRLSRREFHGRLILFITAIGCAYNTAHMYHLRRHLHSHLRQRKQTPLDNICARAAIYLVPLWNQSQPRLPRINSASPRIIA